MEKLVFELNLHASKEKVWNTLWQADNYKNWTSVFAEGSHAETDNWKEGSKVLFLDGNGRGMVSRVAVNKPFEYISFEHLGIVANGEEDTTSEKIKSWSGAKESYTLRETNGTTTLLIEMDAVEEFKSYFEKTWPEALKKIKALAEQ